MMLLASDRIVQFRRPLIVATHFALIPLAYYLAFALRFDFDMPAREGRLLWATLPFLVAIKMAAFNQLGLYRGYWKHVSLTDLMNLSVAVTASSAIFVAVLYLMGSLRGMPRSVLVLDWLVTIFLAGGMRFAARCIREGVVPVVSKRGKRTLILGAGGAGERLIRQCLHDRKNTLHLVGLIDDDKRSHGSSLHGVPVLGSTADLARLTQQHGIDVIVIAISAASGEQMRCILEKCRETEAEVKILPSLDDILNGRAQRGQLRDVQIDDLLGREPVQLDLEQIEKDISGRVVLVTGGAGSIGSELARQIARFGPSRLILFDQAESPLYFVHMEIAKGNPQVDVVPIIGDVTDAERIESVFATCQPDYVFHAAAYKHVPMMEINITEAVRNNVIGTLQVAECAARHGATKFLLISTDKAVNPSSVMGATKRIAERIILGWPALRASGTDFRAVRFGNVLGSDGSVVPLFKRQLAAGGPLTVTHRDVYRYFMTIPEAVQLVLQAAALPEARSRISMLEMGEPVRIVDLAEQLIRLSGLEPYRDIQIVFTGLRPGEKLNEELMAEVEGTIETAVEKIRVVQHEEADPAAIERGVRRLATAVRLGQSGSQLLRELSSLVPEYRPQRSQLADIELVVAQSEVRRAPRIPADVARLPAFGKAIQEAAPR